MDWVSMIRMTTMEDGHVTTFLKRRFSADEGVVDAMFDDCVKSAQEAIKAANGTAVCVEFSRNNKFADYDSVDANGNVMLKLSCDVLTKEDYDAVFGSDIMMEDRAVIGL